MPQRMVKIGPGLVKESAALRQIADNLEQIERLQDLNIKIWRGVAESAEEASGRKIRGQVGEPRDIIQKPRAD